MASSRNCSIVEFFGSDEGHSCGYCKGAATSRTTGMWAHSLATGDYQDLVNRGWRRSGKYLYKPTMDKTCCPQYTIRCDVANFRPSKSHRKVIKRFRQFIITGDTKGSSNQQQPVTAAAVGSSDAVLAGKRLDDAKKKMKMKDEDETEKVGMETECTSLKERGTIAAAPEAKSPAKKAVKPGLGADPSKPRARKAKEIRKEKALLKGSSTPVKTQVMKVKELEDLLEESFPPESSHKFEVRTVLAKTSNPTFSAHYDETLALYKKYQMRIHGDSEQECRSSQFTRFLCDASLVHREQEPGYGGFHQHYLVDGKIVAVGVVDILDNSLSSVYLFYDPDLSFLSLGTLSSLFEISFVRKLCRKWPEIKHYYMGFYIHSCPKMRYKAQYSASYLLCPETYEWVTIDLAKPLLDVTKYSRLNNDESASLPSSSQQNLDSVRILHEQTSMPFRVYKERRNCEERSQEEDDDEVEEYVRLVGMSLAKKMMLYRS